MNEWVSEWMNEWMNEWVSEWMNEWMNKYVYIYICMYIYIARLFSVAIWSVYRRAANPWHQGDQSSEHDQPDQGRPSHAATCYEGFEFRNIETPAFDIGKWWWWWWIPCWLPVRWWKIHCGPRRQGAMLRHIGPCWCPRWFPTTLAVDSLHTAGPLLVNM